VTGRLAGLGEWATAKVANGVRRYKCGLCAWRGSGGKKGAERAGVSRIDWGREGWIGSEEEGVMGGCHRDSIGHRRSGRVLSEKPGGAWRWH